MLRAGPLPSAFARRSHPNGATLGASALAVAGLCVLLCATSRAQIDPDDTGAGTKLGLAQFANSGQVGTVTIFPSGVHRAVVVLNLFSVPPGRSEPARIRRGRLCSSPLRKPVDAITLDDFSGSSRSEVALPAARLLSGNYLIEVFASHRVWRLVSCGTLHR